MGYMGKGVRVKKQGGDLMRKQRREIKDDPEELFVGNGDSFSQVTEKKERKT